MSMWLETNSACASFQTGAAIVVHNGHWQEAPIVRASWAEAQVSYDQNGDYKRLIVRHC